MGQGPTRRSGRGSTFFVFFTHFCNLHKILSILSKTQRVKKNASGGKKKNSAPLVPALFPKISNWRKAGSKSLGGLEEGGGGAVGGPGFEQAAPLGPLEGGP